MTQLERVLEALQVGIPVDIIRNSHPAVVVRDFEDEFEVVLKDRSIEPSKARLNKAGLRIVRGQEIYSLEMGS